MKADKLLKEVPGRPRDLKNFIRTNVVEGTYIIYDKKENVAVCTRCGRKSKVPLEAKHNIKTMCKGCQSNAIYKSAGIGRDSLMESSYLLRFAKKNGTLYAVYSELDIAFKPFGKPDVFIDDIKIFRFGEDREIIRASYGRWIHCGSINLQTQSSTYGWQTPRRYGANIYTNNIDTVFEGIEAYKHINLNELFYKLEIEQFITLLDMHPRNPGLEILMKAGFDTIVEERLRGFKSRSINWKKKTIPEILGVTMGQARKVREDNFRAWQLELFKKQFNVTGKELTIKEISENKQMDVQSK